MANGEQKKVYLIDGSSFLYRAYYALKPMTSRSGVPVGAVFGFCRMLKKLYDTFNPQYMALVWDSKGKTARHEEYAQYKATRQAAPSDIFAQKELIQEFADLIGLKQVAIPAVEADDLLYSLAWDFSEEGACVVLISSDKDIGQTLLKKNCLLVDPFKDQIFDAAALEKYYGFSLEKLPFYFALIGDSSDNIPGVKGIGPKGAQNLLALFSSLDDLYAHIDRVPTERMRNLLLTHRDDAYLSQKLFELRYYKIGVSLEDCAVNVEHWAHARPLFEQFNFMSLLKELEKTSIEGARQEHVALAYSFKTIINRAQLASLCHEIKKAGVCALDTETNGRSYGAAQLVGISLCCQKGEAYYIPLEHTSPENVLMPGQVTREDIFEFLKPLLEDITIKKYLHHAKFDQLMLSTYGIELCGVVFDTMIAAHLVVRDGNRINLKNLSQLYLNETMLTYDEVVKQAGYKDFSFVPLDRATEYAAADAHQTWQLVPLLQKELAENHQETLYNEIELPLINVLYAMEKKGILVDAHILQQTDKQVVTELARLRATIISLVSEKYVNINLSSPKQLEELLFVELKLPPVKKTSAKSGYSTDQEVLLELAKIHPIPGLIIRYRELFKLKSTYIDALQKEITADKRIHTSFSQISTATGRLASSDPNLQNIPVETAGIKVQIRSAFKPEPGHCFISADYSQIELRVLAYLSQEPRLIEAFAQGHDIHAQTASGLFDVPLGQVTHEQRQLGKRINFSILYGLTPYGLSKDLDIPFKEAKIYIEKYFSHYPRVVAWMESVIEETKGHGYVETLFGRRRYLPGIYEKNKTLYDLAVRTAINTKGQGTAAEIMKIGMLHLDAELARSYPQARMILQIHDELLLSVPQDQAEVIQKVATDILQKVVEWNVPLVVTTRRGTDWQEVTK